MHYPISLFLAIHLSVQWFQMPLVGLSFVKKLVRFGIIDATEPLLQNMTTIVCLGRLNINILNYKPL